MKTDEKTWEQSTNTLIDTLVQVADGKHDREYFQNCIERAHRGRPSDHSNHPNIFAAIADWRDSELIKGIFWRNNLNIYCEQKYGPRTTWRRNQALMLRKQLKQDKMISSGYVAYPAKLMVKYPHNSRNDPFVCHQDFSREAVPAPRH